LNNVPYQHQSVLLQETLKILDPKPGDKIVDGTLGLGGHAEAILPLILPGGHYYGFDLDALNLEHAKERLKAFAPHTTFFHSNFAHCHQRLREQNLSQVNGILLDLGLSSPHIDDAVRGFSFQVEGPLDMRFDRQPRSVAEGASFLQMTAADILNTWDESELKRIFYHYGEEPYAPKLARMVLVHRKETPFNTTFDLMNLIGQIMRSPKDQKQVARRLFQALRIAVNDELRVLEETLPSLLDLLAPQGRLVVMSYHSLEDRIVKQCFKAAVRDCHCPPEDLRCTCSRKSDFQLLTKKPVVPSDEELQANPRSRSAKLRAIQKI
jgi:16S rRNA (cytosine1402-N4)-methyltransferase